MPQVTMPALQLTVLDEIFTIHRFSPASGIPKQVLASPFFAVTRTSDELSILAPAGLDLKSDRSETNWAGFRVAGTLDFALTGILAALSAVLAQAGISLFA